MEFKNLNQFTVLVVVIVFAVALAMALLRSA
jgi:hypothetical protein